VNLAVDLNGQPPLQVFIHPTDRPEFVLRSIDQSREQRITTYEEIAACTDVSDAFSIAKAALALAGFLPKFHGQGGYASLRDQLQEFGGGLELTVLAAVPRGSGLGTSSILAAGVLGALSDSCGLGWGHTEGCARALVLEQMLTIYTCGGQARNREGGFTPDGYVRDPNISRRLVPWMCWKWDIKAYLFYAMNVWPQLPTQKDSVMPPEDQPWPTVTQVQKQPVFNLVMPGPDKTLLPTIRLKALRDGMDDHDYLSILRTFTARLDGTPDNADLRKRVERALIVDDRIVTDPFTYTLVPAVLDERRQLVGDLIEEISRNLGQARPRK